MFVFIWIWMDICRCILIYSLIHYIYRISLRSSAAFSSSFPCGPSIYICVYLSRRREHLHARALQIRAELSTHIHRETGPQRPTHSFWSFLFEKTKLECGKKPPAFRQRQAHNAVRHAARSRPARSAPGHRARTRASGPPGRVCMWSRVRARICRKELEKSKKLK